MGRVDFAFGSTDVVSRAAPIDASSASTRQLAQAFRALGLEVNGILVRAACHQQDLLEHGLQRVNATVCDAYLTAHGQLSHSWQGRGHP